MNAIKVINKLSPASVILLLFIFLASSLVLADVVVRGNTITATSANISADWVFAKVNWSDVQNFPSSLTDTNESIRFNALVSSDCGAGELVIGVQINGSVLCVTDSTGAGGTYNATYATWAYNQTSPSILYTDTQIGLNNSAWLSTYNASYLTSYSETDPTVNKTFNQSLTDLLYSPIGSVGNASWNQTLASTLYSSITWNYNQTSPSILFTNAMIVANESRFLSTFNTTYATWSYNMTTPAITYTDAKTQFTSGNINITSGNLSVQTNNKFCLDGSACTKYIHYNGTDIVIQG